MSEKAAVQHGDRVSSFWLALVLLLMAALLFTLVRLSFVRDMDEDSGVMAPVSAQEENAPSQESPFFMPPPQFPKSND